MRHWLTIPAALAAGLVMGGTGAESETLDQIHSVRGSVIAAAAQSQKRIDKMSDQAQELLHKYRTVIQEVESLKVYNTQLEKLITAQQEEKIRLQEEIDGVTEVERGIVPLMLRMVEMIERVVEADVPFLLEERRARVARLRELLNRSDVTVAEKYRLIIEAYSIENNFGHTIEAYTDSIEINGETREVDFLRIGRVLLLYQTSDGDYTGAWNQSTGSWEEVSSSYAGAVRQGLRIARKQAPPDLLLLPTQAAEVLQ